MAQDSGKKTVFKSEDGAHSVHIARLEHLSNGSFAVHLHCCENPETEHRHTVQRVHLLTPAKLDEQLAEIGKFVADQHASMVAAVEHVKYLMGDEPPKESKPSMTVLG